MTELHQGTRWFMRVARLRHVRDQVGHDRFDSAFTEAGLTPSPSRLSRWEYGRASGSPRVLRAYERGADLPPYLLFALNDRRERAARDAFATRPTLDPTEGIEVEQLYDVLDRAIAGAEVTGSEWYLLAAYVSLHEFFYLTPPSTALMARRLLDELTVAVGSGYVLRFEALHLFASVPRVHDALENELQRILEAEPAGLVGEALSVLLRSRRAAPSEITRSMGRSPSRPVRDSVRWLEDVLADRWIQGETAAERRGTHESTALTAALPSWASASIEDDVAPALVRTALHNRSRLRRHEASILLMLADVATNLTGPLLDLLESGSDPDARIRQAQLLEYLLPTVQVDRVLELAIASIREGADAALVRPLWNACGHASAPIPVDDDLLALLAHPEHGYAVVGALAMSGALETVRDEDVPPTLRPTVAWWRARRPVLPS